MKARVPLLWLSSTLLYPLGAVALERQLDKVTLDVFAKDGLCYLYIDKPNFEKSMRPCKTYCEKQGSNEYGVSQTQSDPLYSAYLLSPPSSELLDTGL